MEDLTTQLREYIYVVDPYIFKVEDKIRSDTNKNKNLTDTYPTYIDDDTTVCQPGEKIVHWYYGNSDTAMLNEAL